MEEIHDVLGDKQHVAFDDLAKLHQLGLVTRLSVLVVYFEQNKNKHKHKQILAESTISHLITIMRMRKIEKLTRPHRNSLGI